MSTKICFIHTTTNSNHDTEDNVSTKNLYQYGRLISFDYSIGLHDENYTEMIKKSFIMTPSAIQFDNNYHNITRDKAEKEGVVNTIALTQFKEDMKSVDIIISHNISFHLKAMQVECFRATVTIDFSKYTLVDTMSFNPKYTIPLLPLLIKKLKLKIKSKETLEQIKAVFFNLYNIYDTIQVES